MIRDPTGSYTLVFCLKGVVPSLHPCAQNQISPIPDQSLVRFAVPELRTHPWACGARGSHGASSAHHGSGGPG
jgi:hypothetical protein